MNHWKENNSFADCNLNTIETFNETTKLLCKSLPKFLWHKCYCCYYYYKWDNIIFLNPYQHVFFLVKDKIQVLVIIVNTYNRHFKQLQLYHYNCYLFINHSFFNIDTLYSFSSRIYLNFHLFYGSNLLQVNHYMHIKFYHNLDWYDEVLYIQK